MKLPLFLPMQLDGLKAAKDDHELFNWLTSSLPNAIEFFEILADDPIWGDNHSEFMRKLVTWFNYLYYSGQMGQSSAEKIAQLFHQSRGLIHFIIHDLKLKVGKEIFAVNSILLGTSSSYFALLIKQAQERNDKTLELPQGTKIDSKKIAALLEVIHEGTSDLWRKNSEELEALLKQSESWEIDKLAGTSELELSRLLNGQNALDMLIKARSNHWSTLSEEACNIYNKNSENLKFSINEYSELVAHFYDLRLLTTLKEFQKISPMVSILRFTSDLPRAYEFPEVFKIAPKILGIDFTETYEGPLNLDVLPSQVLSLNFASSSWLDSDSLKAFIDKYPKVARLGFSKNNSLNSMDWVNVASLDWLLDLDVSDVKTLVEDDLITFSVGLNKLERFNMSGCRQVSARAINELIISANQFTHLNLAYTATNDQILSEISLRHKNLEYLNLSYTKHPTQNALMSLIRNCPMLKKLVLTGSGLGKERIAWFKKVYPRIIEII